MTLKKINILILESYILVSSGQIYDSTIFVRPTQTSKEKDDVVFGHMVTCVNLCPPMPADKQIWPLREGKVNDEKYASMLLKYILKNNTPWYLRRFIEFTLCVPPNLNTADMQIMKRCCGNYRVKFIYQPLAFLRQLNVANGIVISLNESVLHLSIIDNNRLIKTFSNATFIGSTIQALKDWISHQFHTEIGYKAAFDNLTKMLMSSPVIFYGPDNSTRMPNKIKLSYCDYKCWLDNASQQIIKYITITLLEIMKQYDYAIYFCNDIEAAIYLRDKINGIIPELKMNLQQNTAKLILDGALNNN